MNFDMVISDELGLKAPIEVGPIDQQRPFAPVRLNQQSVVNQLTDDFKSGNLFTAEANLRGVTKYSK